MRQIRTAWPEAGAYVYEEIDSTNLEVIRRGKEGAPEGTLIAAEKQSAGRGRRGRTWISPYGVAMYMSVLLRPTLPVNAAHILTPVSAFAICEVLQKEGIEAQIKWPNDVVIHGKKVCGILCELTITAPREYFLVTGIGININNREFAPEAGVNGTSLYLETGREYDRETIAEAVMEAYRRYYERVNAAGSLEPIREAFEARLVNRDKTVRVLDPAGEWTGTARGISPMGELLVETADGSLKAVSAGEVSVRGVYGYTE